MFDFSQIKEMKLAKGSHKYPEEGLCFMEMAAWFAGEAHSDRLECACPVLGTYGVGLNDRMPADLRDRLLKPLVPLIVGTRDPVNEWKRAEFLVMWAVNKVLPIDLRTRGQKEKVAACEAAMSFDEAKVAVTVYDFYLTHALTEEYAAFTAAELISKAAPFNKFAINGNERIWTVAVEGLRQAILIGRHDGFADPEPVIVERRAKLVELVSK